MIKKDTSPNCRFKEYFKVSLQSLQKSEKAGLSKITALQNCLTNLNITEYPKCLNCEITATERAQEQLPSSSFHLRNSKRHQKNNNYNKTIEHQKYVLTKLKIFKKFGLFIKEEKSNQ